MTIEEFVALVNCVHPEAAAWGVHVNASEQPDTLLEKALACAERDKLRETLISALGKARRTDLKSTHGSVCRVRSGSRDHSK